MKVTGKIFSQLIWVESAYASMKLQSYVRGCGLYPNLMLGWKIIIVFAIVAVPERLQDHTLLPYQYWC